MADGGGGEGEGQGQGQVSQSVRVSFSDLSFIQISQNPKMTGFSLISSVGGTLGLFIGIRFLSLVEVLEYVSEVYLVVRRGGSGRDRETAVA